MQTLFIILLAVTVLSGFSHSFVKSSDHGILATSSTKTDLTVFADAAPKSNLRRSLHGKPKPKPKDSKHKPKPDPKRDFKPKPKCEANDCETLDHKLHPKGWSYDPFYYQSLKSSPAVWHSVLPTLSPTSVPSRVDFNTEVYYCYRDVVNDLQAAIGVPSPTPTVNPTACTIMPTTEPSVNIVVTDHPSAVSTDSISTADTQSDDLQTVATDTSSTTETSGDVSASADKTVTADDRTGDVDALADITIVTDPVPTA